mmetsp:Transcript_58811/g.140214  ORF Transcript_58811/g.140214 Transcript_58811/m.140214 type:complete len:259 (-) Transcript_58811:332-1108(-)|eukprot:CAMPEP_0178403404 /NCGR_PEP_ID=MMETSP0689_2-20121128/17349_1 /TAXON_ID=160604 /ORGANISM="Amphidinium massartii, Strain CS-259" /LENGTH=258 /DNA_ID=CAMNT_0020024353 /DNA_START=104 /DNA_END=880 /DNA_ORIENTATION=+
MGRSDQISITVVEADLVRIFDKVMKKQDVYAQLVSTYDDGTRNVVGRTQICRDGNMKPRWSESFTYSRGRAMSLTFQVIADRAWRGEVLCGEAVVDMAGLWNRAYGGAPVLLPLVKNEGQTGVLHLLLGQNALQGLPGGGRSSSAPHARGPKRSSSASSSASSARSGGRRSRGFSDDSFRREVPVVGTGCQTGCMVPLFRGRSRDLRAPSTEQHQPTQRRSASAGATVRAQSSPATERGGGGGLQHPSSWWNSFIQRG